MKFKGVLLRESLADESVLDLFEITKTEIWDVKNATENQPKVWHALFYEGDTEKTEEIAEKLSKALKQSEWYINFTADNQVYVVFSQKVFVYPKGDQTKREEIKKYGRSIHFAETQLDWDE